MEELREQLLALIAGDRPLAESEAALVRLQCFWPDVAGSLARHCQPVGIRGQRLLIRVEKSVYAQEMQLASRSILERAQKLTSLRLDRLQIEQGPIDWSAQSGGRIPSSARPGIGAAPADTDPTVELDKERMEMIEGLRKLL